MKKEISYIQEGKEKTCIVSYNLEDGAKIDGVGFDEAYEWEGEEDEAKGLSDLVDFVTENLNDSGCEITKTV